MANQRLTPPPPPPQQQNYPKAVSWMERQVPITGHQYHNLWEVTHAVSEIAALIKHADTDILTGQDSFPYYTLKIISDKAFDVFEKVDFRFCDENENE